MEAWEIELREAEKRIVELEQTLGDVELKLEGIVKEIYIHW